MVLDRPLARDGVPLSLVGRRDLRSNNSWMHTLPVLVKGKARRTVRYAECGEHPARLGSRRRRHPDPHRDRNARANSNVLETGPHNLELDGYVYPGDHTPPAEVPKLVVQFFQRHLLSTTG